MSEVVDAPVAEQRIVTIPNLITSVRISMVLVLLWLAWTGKSDAFLICFVASLATDFFDGYLARRLNQVTKLGSQLDSFADISTFLVMPLCAWWLWKDVIIAEAVFIIIGMVSYLTPVVLGLIKYGRLPSFHTWGAKTMTVVMSASVVALLAGWSPWPLRVFTPLIALEAIEEIVMIAILPRWHPNIPGLWVAFDIRRAMLAEEEA